MLRITVHAVRGSSHIVKVFHKRQVARRLSRALVALGYDVDFHAWKSQDVAGPGYRR